jgi:hypothetical protein
MRRVAPKLYSVHDGNDPRGQTPTPLRGRRPPRPPTPSGPRRYAPTQQAPDPLRAPEQAADGYASTNRPPTLRAHATGRRPATRPHRRPLTLRLHATGLPATRPRNRPPTLRSHVAGPNAAGGPQAPQTRPAPGGPRRYALTQQAADPLRAHTRGSRRYALTQQSLDGYAPTNKPPTATRSQIGPLTLRLHLI